MQSLKNLLYKMKTIYLLCAILALIACFNLPIGYYTFLRIALTLGALTVLYNEVQKDVNLLGISFIAIAILFNPILPVYLYQKSLWIAIDIITAILFLVYWLSQQLKK
ncbi:MAG: hypothetical protein O9267_12185 [Flavobacterium sp.]|uniref:DUF6804 family protein n=1 Tax=Flavobacterium sp. TaxID=239 RepID=UPI0022CB8AD0|nr:DUF6804 family protein [Flavobacterium sp.]MCZ8198355.1 hypothetical protein [Flavobacterium sp.]